MRFRLASCAILSLALVPLMAHGRGVTLLRTPDHGLQPQAVLDAQGTLHLLYFKGDPNGGDLFYRRRPPGKSEFSAPLPVNSRSGSALAIGTIRGAQLAIGRAGRAHVAWNGPVPKNGGFMQAPMLYTRLNDAGTAFEPERDVITSARGLDGGGSVAADNQGSVFVLWHAPIPGSTNGEAGRGVFVARSRDDGGSFAPEHLASPRNAGACGCCG